MLGTEVEFLFVRFAWAVLYQVKGFLLMGRPKTLLARYRVWEDGVARVKEQGMLAKDVDLLYGGGGTRSASPRKRSRTSSEQGRDKVEWGNTYDGNGRAWRDTTVFEDEERGRKRTRDEDVRHGKRRRVHAGDISAVPSLAETGSSASVSSVSASPRPGPSLPVEHAGPKEDHDQYFNLDQDPVFQLGEASSTPCT